VADICSPFFPEENCKESVVGYVIAISSHQFSNSLVEAENGENIERAVKTAVLSRSSKGGNEWS